MCTSLGKELRIVMNTGWTIQRSEYDKNVYKVYRDKGYPYTVIVTSKGVECNCHTYYDNKLCKHSQWIKNMMYIIEVNPDSLLMAQYADLLRLKGLGQNSGEYDYALKINSLDEITHEDNHYVWGKYYSRDDGKFLSIEVRKPL